MQVNGYSGARYRGYKTYEEARAAWVHAQSNNVVGPSPHITASTGIPSPRPLTVLPSQVPDMCRLHSNRNFQAIVASPSLPLQEPQSPSPGEVLPNALFPASVLPSLPVSSHARRPVVVNHRVGSPSVTLKLSDEEVYWVVIAGVAPGVYHGK
jgi:hypothetical protein